MINVEPLHIPTSKRASDATVERWLEGLIDFGLGVALPVVAFAIQQRFEGVHDSRSLFQLSHPFDAFVVLEMSALVLWVLLGRRSSKAAVVVFAAGAVGAAAIGLLLFPITVTCLFRPLDGGLEPAVLLLALLSPFPVAALYATAALRAVRGRG